MDRLIYQRFTRMSFPSLGSTWVVVWLLSISALRFCPILWSKWPARDGSIRTTLWRASGSKTFEIESKQELSIWGKNHFIIMSFACDELIRACQSAARAQTLRNSGSANERRVASSFWIFPNLLMKNFKLKSNYQPSIASKLISRY